MNEKKLSNLCELLNLEKTIKMQISEIKQEIEMEFEIENMTEFNNDKIKISKSKDSSYIDIDKKKLQEQYPSIYEEVAIYKTRKGGYRYTVKN